VVQPSESETVLAGRYRIDRKIANGGMAEVWLATDLFLDRVVAVKVLKQQLASDPTAVERFRREARIVAQLEHPNIVSIHDSVEHDGRQAVVMPFVPGKSLRDLLDEKKHLSPEQTLNIASSVAGALDAAHTLENPIIHRDVKPANILITPDNHVLLTDFGIAKVLTSSTNQDLTSENIMMGTAKYLSPEQVRGHELDGRADLYSLGLVLYECLAGKVPFKGNTDAETALARIQRDPTPLGKLRPQLHPGLLHLVKRLLARDPANRPASGAEVVAMVEQIRNNEFTSATWPRLDASGAPRLDARSGARGPGSNRPSADRPATPPNGTRPRHTPNRQLQQRRSTPTFIVAGLLVAALAIGGVLWAALRNGSKNGSPESTSITATGQSAAVVTTPDGQPVPFTDSKVTALTSFDPKGDGTENESKVRLARDGKTGTAWVTSCYQNQYFGAKQGVGLIVKLSGPAQGLLNLTFPSSPWNVDVYASASPAAGLEDWGAPVSQNASQKANKASIVLNQPGHYLLLMLREVARDKGCSSANPFRGGFSEISFGPAQG
jgi:serine/threonine-protein kinase